MVNAALTYWDSAGMGSAVRSRSKGRRNSSQTYVSPYAISVGRTRVPHVVTRGGICEVRNTVERRRSTRWFSIVDVGQVIRAGF